MRLCAPRRGIGKSAPSSASVKPSTIESTPSAVHVAGRSTRLGQERMAALTGVILAKGGCPITPKGGVLGPFRARLDRGWTLTPSRGEWRWSVPLPLRRVFFGGIYLWFMPRLQQDSAPFARGVRKDDAPESKRPDESVCCES